MAQRRAPRAEADDVRRPVFFDTLGADLPPAPSPGSPGPLSPHAFERSPRAPSTAELLPRALQRSPPSTAKLVDKLELPSMFAIAHSPPARIAAEFQTELFAPLDIHGRALNGSLFAVHHAAPAAPHARQRRDRRQQKPRCEAEAPPSYGDGLRGRKLYKVPASLRLVSDDAPDVLATTARPGARGGRGKPGMRVFTAFAASAR